VTAALAVDLARALRFRARATRLDRRLPAGSWRLAAYGGLQDSAPRAALLALHARLEGTGPGAWEHPDLVQVWLRCADYVVPAADFAVFTLGTLPRDPERAAAVERTAAAVREVLDGRALRTREVVAALSCSGRGVLCFAQAAALFRIRWDARTVTLLPTERPDVEPEWARLELARRFLGWHGPATADQFAKWAGIARPDAAATWAALAPELVPVAMDGRARDVLASDVDALAACAPPSGVRLLPMGDPHLAIDWREALAGSPPPPVEDEASAPLTSRLVNSLTGRVLVDGRIAGAWGRAAERMAIHLWRQDDPDRERVAAEAASLAGPIGRPMRLRWLR
jgi:Winged helix DNA-binding domain